ncbi:MAG: hypothetical protein KJ709_06535 [Nanoarchaeota archaeon]|nr:hypothetical protein [Nanoarchaeota archaeon]
MTELIACLSTGKGTWAEVSKLIAAEEWDNVFLITNEFGQQKFSAKADFILISDRMPMKQLVSTIHSQLQNKVRGTEVAINLSSGTGKEHMAILSAILKLGVGIRLVDIGLRGVIEV